MSRATQRQAKRLRVALEGQCWRCGSPSVKDRSYCQRHLAEERVLSLARYRRAHPWGSGVQTCGRCGKRGHIRTVCKEPKRAGEGRR